MSTIEKLSSLAIVSAGQGAPQGEENYCINGVPFIKAGNLIELLNGKKENEVQNVNELVAKQHRLKRYPAGTVLFAKSGMSCMKGYVYVLQSDCYVVSHLACITPVKTTGAYLKYYFEYHKPNTLIKDEAYPSISLSDIGNLDIMLYSPEIQSEIVCKLDSMSLLIKHRKEQLLKIDNLVKSQFIEMFGNPVHNDKGWNIKLLDAVAEIGSSKRVFEREYTQEGIPFFRTKEIVELAKGHPISTELFISRDRYDEIKATYGCPQKGDLLISAVGTIGIIWVVDDRKFYFKDGNLLQVRIRNNESPDFLKYVLEWLIDDYKKGMAKGTAYSALTINSLKNIRLIDVPLSLQNEFARFVEQTDKSKVLMKCLQILCDFSFKSVLYIRMVEKDRRLCYNISTNIVR